eukprot:sb/3478206/
MIEIRNRPNQEILVPNWLTTSHVTYITSSDCLLVSVGACSVGMFKCSNNLCIDAALECDGTDDCGDNSDETSTTCYNRVALRMSVLLLTGIVIWILSVKRRC